MRQVQSATLVGALYQIHICAVLDQGRALAALQQPKMLALSSGKEPMVIDLDEEQLEDRVERVVARIQHATFTGKGDQQVVPALYKAYVDKLADALVQTLALAGAEAAHAPTIPPMPIVPLPEAEPQRPSLGAAAASPGGHEAWGRLVHSILRIFRLRRLFNSIGVHLQSLSALQVRRLKK